jgi:methylenetetrahydrofolate dehydrogenase (NADP+)/methenyltetrahydrofolate cyclohydrolase
MSLIDGLTIAFDLRLELKDKIKHFKSHKKYDIDSPHLVAILVGHDPASIVYIRQKEKACLEVGIHFTLVKMETYSTTHEVVEKIKYYNSRSDVNGCIVQLPLPEHIDTDSIIMAISPDKDVDCFHPYNIGLMSLKKPRFIPATPFGIKMLLEHIKVPIKGKNCVIIGKSLIVGQPLMNLLSLEHDMGATVTCCDKYTENLHHYTKRADILIVAAGVHHLINHPDMVKQGVTIIDVGIHRIFDDSLKEGYRLEGDVNFELLRHKAAYITPVPGGVGPMTVVALLYNTYYSYIHHHR